MSPYQAVCLALLEAPEISDIKILKKLADQNFDDRIDQQMFDRCLLEILHLKIPTKRKRFVKRRNKLESEKYIEIYSQRFENNEELWSQPVTEI